LRPDISLDLRQDIVPPSELTRFSAR
jgi:hypothetical protein